MAGSGSTVFGHLNQSILAGSPSYSKTSLLINFFHLGGKELAADTNNMRTPHPHLSNLEEGVYTFVLKVTDSKGQTSEDQVLNSRLSRN